MRFLLLALVLAPLAACQTSGPPRQQNLLVTYSRITTDRYDASGDLNNTNGFENDDEPDVDGWSVGLDLDLGGNLGASVAYSDREYGDDAEAEEWSGGLKYWLGGQNSYLIGLVRYAEELELNDVTSTMNGDSYWGYGIGTGITSQATENIFLDLRVVYEGLFDDISIGTDQIDLKGFVVSIGVGLLF